MTTVHSYTNDQNTLDAPQKVICVVQKLSSNIVPNSTRAAKAIGLVLPELKEQTGWRRTEVPTITGSLTELTCVLGKTVTKEEIHAAMKAASMNFGIQRRPRCQLRYHRHVQVPV